MGAWGLRNQESWRSSSSFTWQAWKLSMKFHYLEDVLREGAALRWYCWNLLKAFGALRGGTSRIICGWTLWIPDSRVNKNLLVKELHVKTGEQNISLLSHKKAIRAERVSKSIFYNSWRLIRLDCLLFTVHQNWQKAQQHQDKQCLSHLRSVTTSAMAMGKFQ